MKADPEKSPKAMAQSAGDDTTVEQFEVLDPNDSNRIRDQIRGQTAEHALPPRLEDEGQSGG